jgi:hypothetical protein
VYSSIRTRDGAFSVVGAVLAQEAAGSKVALIDLPGVWEWAKSNGLKVPRSDKALGPVNSARAANGLPRFVLRPSLARSEIAKPRRPPSPPAPLRPIASTEDELLELVANHSGTVTGLVTADFATWLLALNTGNRNVMPENVARFRRMLQEGRWQNTGEPIIVSQEGILNDGQHRLIAIKDTGIAAEADVRFGVARVAFKATGTGKRRSSAQVLGIEGYSNTTTQASIARLMMAYDANQMATFRQRSVEADEVLAMVDSDDRIPEVAAKIRRLRFAPVRAGGFGFVLAIACRNTPSDKVFEFADLVASGLVSDETNPARRLHVRLRDAAMRRERKDQLDLALITAKAWNAWVQGQSIQAFRLSEADRTSEGFPVIRGAEPAPLAA